MPLRLAALFLLFLTSAARAQVTTDPATPTTDRPVTIFFDARQGDRGLAGFTGTVFAHTGVITPASTTPSDWKYVVAPWRDTTSTARLTRVEPDRYRLDIPDIRAFYGVPDDVAVLQLAFVFWGAGGGEGRGPGGADLFVDVVDERLAVRFLSPTPVDTLTPAFTGVGDTLRVVATAGLVLATLRLFVDDAVVAETTSDTLRHALVFDTPGRRTLRIEAEDAGARRAMATADVLVNAPLTPAPLPAGIVDGVNLEAAGPGTATFVLDGPGKRYVYVVGDFTDWGFDPDYAMTRGVGADSTRFWVTVSGLEDGVEYAFQYVVDGEVRVADPYSAKVLHPEDAQIAPQTYPGLRAYPEGETRFTVSLFDLDPSEYDWQTTDFERPPQHELVIYELLVRDFVARHDFATVLDSLDYLADLGVNAVELLPVTEFEFLSSWGYNPVFMFATDKYYGPADDLKRFIDACHARGIAVILDQVLNHNFGRAPFVRLDNDGDFGPPTDTNPWLNRVARHPANVGYDFNHESLRTQAFVDRVNRYWLEEFRVDGFRFDLSKGFTQNFSADFGAWARYDADRIRLLTRMADRIWTVDSTAYIVLEHFAENREEKELAEYRTADGRPGMMLWGNMSSAYNEATMGYHDGGKSNLSGAYFGSRGWDAANLVAYMESHDEQRLMFKNLAFGNRAPGYDTRALPVALDRMKLAAAFFFTIPGPKLMWQFGELGYEVDIDFNGRTGEKPIRWDYLDDSLRRKLRDAYAALIHLRRAEPVFHDPATEVELSVIGVVKRIKLSHPTMDAVVVGNFDVVDRAIPGRFHRAGWWYDYFSGDSLLVDDLNTALPLLPGEFHLYTSRRLPPPEPGLITVDAERDEAAPAYTAALHPNYPNPFREETTLTFTMPRPGPVRLEIFDSLGRRVATLVDGDRPEGIHAATWKPGEVSAGVYLARLTAGSYHQLRPLVFRP